MKKTGIVLNVLLISILLLSIGSCHNDFIAVFDWVIVVFIILDNIIIRHFVEKKIIALYLFLSVIQLLYGLFTVSSNEETGFVALRIVRMLSVNIGINYGLLSFIEYTWLVTIVLVIIGQFYMFWWSYVKAVVKKKINK